MTILIRLLIVLAVTGALAFAAYYPSMTPHREVASPVGVGKRSSDGVDFRLPVLDVERTGRPGER